MKGSFFRQLRIFTKEYRTILFSNKRDLLVSLLFPVLAVLIIVWIAGENLFVDFESSKSACFVMVSAAIWGGLFNSIQSVVSQRENIKRDYLNGLILGSYTLSRAVVQLFVCVFQSGILSLSFILIEKKYKNSMPEKGVVFESAFLEYYISILLVMFAADMLGLMISCIVKKRETANVLSPYILIIQLIFSGVLFSLDGIADKISNIMISRWGMEALGSISNFNDIPLAIQFTYPDIPHGISTEYTYTVSHLTSCWFILTAFSIVTLFIGTICLHSIAKDTR